MNRQMKISYLVTQANGQVIPGFEKIGKFEYTENDGNMLPIIEKALKHSKVNDTVCVHVLPKDGFGDYLNTQRDTFSRREIDADHDMQVDDLIALPVSGYSQFARVFSVDSNQIVLDANHPLAGIPLNFHVTVEDIK